MPATESHFCRRDASNKCNINAIYQIYAYFYTVNISLVIMLCRMVTMAFVAVIIPLSLIHTFAQIYVLRRSIMNIGFRQKSQDDINVIKVALSWSIYMICTYWKLQHCCSVVQFSRMPRKTSQIARFSWPTWCPPGSCRPQLGAMWAPWTLLSGTPLITGQGQVWVLYI